MSLTLDEIVKRIPDPTKIIGWGEARLAAPLIRDMTTWASRHSESVKYAFVVDVETANFLNHDQECSLTLNGDYRPARQDGTRVGSLNGADVHVYDLKLEGYYLTLVCLNEDGSVDYVTTTKLYPPERQINVIPVVTPDNVKALNGNFQG